MSVSETDKQFVERVARWRNTTPDSHRIAKLESALRKIERFGHGLGCGRGYMCANIAAEALKPEKLK